MDSLKDIQEAKNTLVSFLETFQKDAYLPVQGGAPAAPPPPGAPMPPPAGAVPAGPAPGGDPSGSSPSAAPEQAIMELFSAFEEIIPLIQEVKKSNEELKTKLGVQEQTVMELKAQVSQLEKALSNPLGIQG